MQRLMPGGSRLSSIRGGPDRSVHSPVRSDLRLDAMLLAVLGMALGPMQEFVDGRRLPRLCSARLNPPATPDEGRDGPKGHGCVLTSSRIDDEDAEG